MATHNISKAWIQTADGTRYEVQSVRIAEAVPPPEENGDSPMYNFADAMRSLVFEVEITGEAFDGLARMLRQVEYKRWMCPLVYRLQPKRSRIVRIVGQVLGEETHS